VTQLDVNAIAQEHFARLHRAALVMTGSPWDADDLAQEVFVVLAKNPNQFRGKSSVYTWLYGILLNLERRQRRRHGTNSRKLKVLWDEGAARAEKSPAAEAPIEAAEWKKSLWSRVARLPDGQREAVVLRFSEGLRYDEIAEVLECPLGTVKSRIHHGLANLRDIMESDGASPLEMPEHPREDENHAV